MITRIIDEKSVRRLKELIDDSEKILIISHTAPDGDAIGSSLAAMHVLMSIGKELGDRNHTTILYSRDKVQSMIDVNDKMAKDIDDIKNIILKK